MSRHCPRCDQLLLDDETVCWQCGYELGMAVEERQPTIRESWQGQKQGFQVSALVVYAGLTVAVITVALLVTTFLGRQPQLQDARVTLPPSWSFVSNRARTFTVALPQEWSLLDGEDEDGRLRQLVAENRSLSAATAPLGTLTDDTIPIFLAGSEPLAAPGMFLLVAHSETLAQLTEEEAASLVGESEWPDTLVVSNVTVVENYDKRHLFFEVEQPDVGAAGLFCRQQFTSGLLIALCSRPDAMGRETADTILQSFQRLTR